MSEASTQAGPATGPVRSITVCLPVLNGDLFLGRVLEGLLQQECSIPWEFLALDCGSTDRTLELIADFAERAEVPVRVHGIHRSEFNHADTRNQLAALSKSDLCIFLTDDAIPVGKDWLSTFAAVFDDPEVWAAYLRNTPRPEADILAKATSEFDEGYAAGERRVRFPSYQEFEALSGDERRTLFNYNDTASAVRRSVWERFPYPRCDFGEDVLLARGLLEGGGLVVYTDKAVIHHSHEYEPELIAKRTAEDSAFNAQWLQRLLVHQDKDMAPQVDKLLKRDEAFLRENGLEGEELKTTMERARAEREALIAGAREGSKVTRRFTLGAMLEGSRPVLRWRAAAAGLDALEGLQEALDGLKAAGWDVAPGDVQPGDGTAELPAVQILAGVDDSMRDAFERAAQLNQPTLVLVSATQAAELGMQKAVHSAWEWALPERVAKPPFPELWSTAVTGVPGELFTWRSAAELDELRGAGRGVQATAAEERLAILPVRLRGLAARSLRARPQVTYDEPGTHVKTLLDGARILDPVRVLIPPGGAAEWELTGGGVGHRVLLIQIEGLGSEPTVLLGGRAFVNGELLTGLGPFRIGSGDEWRVLRVPLVLKPGPNILRLEGRTAEGAKTTLRILRMVLLDLSAPRRNRSPLEDSFDLRGHDGELKAGPRGGELQDCDQMLLGPKAGAAEYAVDGHVAGDYDGRLVLHFTPEESTVIMAGRLLVDGVATARIGPVACPAGGGNVEVRFTVCLPGGRSVLRFENKKRPFGNLAFLRIRRIVLTPKHDGPAVVPTPLQAFLQLPPRVGI